MTLWPFHPKTGKTNKSWLHPVLMLKLVLPWNAFSWHVLSTRAWDVWSRHLQIALIQLFPSCFQQGNLAVQDLERNAQQFSYISCNRRCSAHCGFVTAVLGDACGMSACLKASGLLADDFSYQSKVRNNGCPDCNRGLLFPWDPYMSSQQTFRVRDSGRLQSKHHSLFMSAHNNATINGQARQAWSHEEQQAASKLKWLQPTLYRLSYRINALIMYLLR